MLALVRACLALLALAVLVLGRVSAEGLNNFTVTDYRIEYHLSRDDEQRSVLKTTETITADFYAANQNHGIERLIPKHYDGHPTSLNIISVTDGTGADRQFSTYTEGDFLVVRIGDPDKYVLGKQTYVITYTQRDVTKHYKDTNSDEFYWDTNGTGWVVPINNLAVSLTIDESLVGKLTGNIACYQGVQGSTKTCELAKEGNNFTASATNLNPHENITLAIGFQPHTFAAYKMPLWQKLLIIWAVLQALLAVVGLGVIIWLTKRYYRWKNGRKEIITIVPEYLPPKGVSVATAGLLLGTFKSKRIAAQLIDFAVRGYLKLYQTREKTPRKPAEYKIEVVKDVSSLSSEEQDLLKAMYGRIPEVGNHLHLSTLRESTNIHSQLNKNAKEHEEKLIRGTYGLRKQDPAKSAWFARTGKVLLILSIALLSPALLIAAVVAFAMGKVLWPLTDKGLELLRHLEGLKRYISVAEEERLRVLQSPGGAQKILVKDGKLDTVELIKLYERLLPYAILFGQEKEWNKRLARYYEETKQSPDWIAGQRGALSSAAFLSAMNDISSPYYGSASYSSSGGSTGGGFSGGGGGGGGGRGW